MKEKYKPLLLTNDLVMKRTFGNEQYPEHLLALIRTITQREYQSIRIINPYNEGEFRDIWNNFEELDDEARLFYSINDIKAQTETDDYILVEMQRFYNPDFRKRLWIYICQLVLSQHKPNQTLREFYKSIRPIHVIAIQDYKDPDRPDDAIEEHDCLPDYITNDPLFQSGLATITFFNLHNTEGLTHDQLNLQLLFKGKKMKGKVDPAMAQASQVSNYYALSPSEKADYDRLADLADYSRGVAEYLVKKGEDKGVLKGISIGELKGRTEGIAIGEQKGRTEERQANEAKNRQMLHQMIRDMYHWGDPIAKITAITGYDPQAIEQILKETD